MKSTLIFFLVSFCILNEGGFHMNAKNKLKSARFRGKSMFQKYFWDDKFLGNFVA